MALVVYRSSAGSGKTYTLVKQYLEIALSPPLPDRYRQILAITFTNKAASEMKERILSTLKAIASGQAEGTPAIMASELETALETTPEILKERAAIVLKHMLHNYSDLSISTIDKFTHRIIRTFAFDLHVPVNFEVELDEQAVVAGTADLLLEKAGQDEMVTKILTEFSITRAEDNQYWDIENEIRTYALLLLREETFDVLDSDGLSSPSETLSVRSSLYKSAREFENRISSIGEKASGIMKSAGIEPESLAGGSRGIGVFFEKLSRLEKIQPGASIIKAAEKDDWSAGKAPQSQKSAIEAIRNDLAALFSDLENELVNYPRYILQKLIIKNLYGTALLSELSLSLGELKSRDNILPISEFNRILSGIIRNEPAPFIYERLGEKYRHFLIDEFQDTSRLQWHNLLPLLENGLSSGSLSLIVGDAKQSIYRWRGGESEQFVNLPEVKSDNNQFTRDRARVLEQHFQERVLTKNFRSCPTVVNFNNDFFSFTSAGLPQPWNAVYRELRQETREGSDGFVRIAFAGNAEMKKEETRALFLDQTVSQIRELTNAGAAEGEIAVLVRTNADGAAVASRLNTERIPVISQESLLVGSSIKVKLVCSLMQTLFQPFEQSHRIKIISALNQAGRLGNILWRDLKNPDEFRALLRNNGIEPGRPDDLMRLSLYDLAETTLRNCGFAKDADPYLTAFLDQVHQFRKKSDSSPLAFFRWWNETGCNRSINMPEGINAVKILSIHKSKGLEFPYVILPFMNWQSRNDTRPVWVPYGDAENKKHFLVNFSSSLKEAGMEEIYETELAKSVLDELNLLYVAFTRPVKGLFIFSSFAGQRSRIPAMLKDYLAMKEKWSEHEQVFDFGELKVLKTAGKEIATRVPGFSSVSWPEMIRITPIAPENWNPLEPNSEKEKGNILHQLLSECQKISDAPDRALSFNCPDHLKDWLKDTVARLSKDPAVAEVFDSDGQVLVERDITDPAGNIYRPDRVTISDGRTIVVDFKTGKPSPAHKKQISTYTEKLAEIGYQDISRYIIYVGNDNIEVVT